MAFAMASNIKQARFIIMMQRHYKFLVALSMLYTAVAMADLVLVYRLSTVEGILISAGVYVMPIYYLIEDMIAELYGYARVRQVIWTVQACALAFSLIVIGADSLPVPKNWVHLQDYQFVFMHLFRTLLGGGIIGMIGGAFFNGYLISRWKIILHGRFFIFRSIGASAIGQLLQTVLGCFLLYTTILSFKEIIEMILPIYFIQLLGSVVLAFPAAIFVRWLKKIEGIDVYDHHVNYNPFKFSAAGE
jgi:uncharacterized integral membrane protein (TIGR00697 family)